MSELSKEDAIHNKNNNIDKEMNIVIDIKNDSEEIDSDNEELPEEEDEDYTISLKEKENTQNSDIEEEEEKDNSNIINIYKRHYDTPSSMKKKVNFYKKSNKRTILKRKKYFVHQLLQRWWYALPPWPPHDYDPSEKLKSHKLRLVNEKNWKKEVEVNSDNYKKCVELPGYKYVYVTKEGKVYDFRPEDGKPSFNNLMKLNDIELHQYIVKALQNQLNDLQKKNFFSEKELKMDIKRQLKIAKNNLSNLKGKNNK